MDSFTLGENTPYVKYVQVYECIDAGGRTPMTWTNVGSPPPQLTALQQYQLVIEADVGLQCDDFKMVFRTRVKMVLLVLI